MMTTKRKNMNKDDLAFARAYTELFFMQSPQEKCNCRRCKREIALVKSLNPVEDKEVWVDCNGSWGCQGLDPHDPMQ